MYGGKKYVSHSKGKIKISVYKGRVNEAYEILEKAVRINGKELSPDLQLKALNEISSNGAQDENDKENTVAPEDAKKVTFLDLFKTPNLRKNTLIQYFNWFTATFVYYGLTLNADTLIPGEIICTLTGMTSSCPDSLLKATPPPPGYPWVSGSRKGPPQ